MESANRSDETARLRRSFYRRDAVEVARGLLGQRLVSHIGGSRTSGVIVETEAYLGTIDKAAHTYDGRRTARNETMWGDGGHVYVYFVYGMHHCANVVAGDAGKPVAALLRALEPDGGLDLMFQRRGPAKRPTDLCSGPGKLCQALGISRANDGEDLVTGQALFIEKLRERALPSSAIGCGHRVGIDYADEWRYEPLRFWVRGNRNISSAPGPAS